MSSKSWRIFSFIVVFLLCLICLINFLIDPYGRYGTDILNVNQIDPRTYIVKKLDSAWPWPKLLLFGSSRCLKFNPQYNSELPGVNVALYAGAIEDHYCILRYAIDNNKYPIKVVVIGLEPDLMISSHPVDKMLAQNKQLSRWLNKSESVTIQSLFTPPKYIEEISSLLSIITLRHSLSVFFSYMQKIFNVREASASTSEKTQSSVSSVLEKIIEERDSINARLRQYRSLYLGARELDTTRIDYLNRFAELTRKHKIRVIIFHPGYSKEFWDEMSKLKSFRHINNLLDTHIDNLRTKYGWEIVDFRPHKWAGQKLDFPDGIHPSGYAATLIDNKLESIVNYGL